MNDRDIFLYDNRFFPDSLQKLSHFLRPLSTNTNPEIFSKNYPWEIIELIPDMIHVSSNFKQAKKNSSLCVSGDIFIEENVHLPEIGYIKGPVYIGKKADLQVFSMITGPAFIGEGSRIGPYSSIRSSVLCPNVMIGQYIELTRSIVFEDTEIAHKNIIGDSFIGRSCWFAGESSIANLRIDKKTINAFFNGRVVPSRIKYGATVENNVNVPACVKIMPGSYISNRMNIKFQSTINGTTVLALKTYKL